MLPEWLRLAQKVCVLQAAQEQNGIAFDIEEAKKLLARIEEDMKKIEDEVLPQLPPRKLKKSEEANYRMPKKPWVMTGEYSELMIRFAAKHGGTLNPDNTMTVNGEVVEVASGAMLDVKLPMQIGNQDDLKDWLLAEGWSPSLWNFKKDARGKPIRDERKQLIKTSPKIQEAGRLCPNLEALNGPLVKLVVRFLSLRNRHSVLQGWLDNPRLQWDGRLTASVSGLAATHRKKHSTIVNLPKADGEVLLGVEFRSLFCAAPGKVLVGYDFQALEARIEAHYTRKLEGGEEYAKELVEGDIHTKTAAFVFSKELSGLEIVKDNPLVKPWRHKAKTTKYSLSYGAGEKKLAATLGVPQQRGKEIYEAFWKAAKPLAILKDRINMYYETHGHLKGILGAPIKCRSEHGRLNTLFQHAGSVCMDMSQVILDGYLGGLKGTSYILNGHEVKRVAEVHDEALWEMPPEIVETFSELAVKAVAETGKVLKLNVPLVAEAKSAKTWAGLK